MNAHQRANANARNARCYRRALLAHWDAADAATRATGTNWYADAQNVARELAERYELPLASVAGAIAALSPRTRWNENQSDARKLCDWYVALRDDPNAPDIPLVELRRELYAVSMAQVEKACDALGSADPLADNVLRGPKERAFCANILGDPDAVTVDVWITRAATRGRQDSPSANDYVQITRAIRFCAAKVGVAPRDFQAAVWVQVRGKGD